MGAEAELEAMAVGEAAEGGGGSPRRRSGWGVGEAPMDAEVEAAQRADNFRLIDMVEIFEQADAELLESRAHEARAEAEAEAGAELEARERKPAPAALDRELREAGRELLDARRALREADHAVLQEKARAEGRTVDTDEGLTMAHRALSLYQFALEAEEDEGEP